MAVAKREGEQLVGPPVVRVEHVLHAEKVVVGHAFGHVEVLGRYFRVLQRSNQRLAEVQLVDLEVDFEQLVDHVDHRFALRCLQAASEIWSAEGESVVSLS